MSFRITPEDVGRSVKMRHGGIGKITGYDETRNQPVRIEDVNGIGRYGVDGTYRIGGDTSKFDAIAWADEPETDQVIGQNRSKDLRDEFAMAVAPEIMRSMLPYWSANDGSLPEEGYVEAIKRSYQVADVAMKTREVKQ